VVRDNQFRTFRYTVKDTMIFIGLSFIAFPLLFIPVYDAMALTHEKVTNSLKHEYRSAVWIITSVVVLFNFVPVFNIFGPFFGVIAMFHYFKQRKQSEVGV